MLSKLVLSKEYSALKIKNPPWIFRGELIYNIKIWLELEVRDYTENKAVYQLFIVNIYVTVIINISSQSVYKCMTFRISEVLLNWELSE